jgi:hypothetical protein
MRNLNYSPSVSRPKRPWQIPNKQTLHKKVFGAVQLFSTTYFDELIIYGLSEDQTFRNWSAFKNPEQFLILVTHLLI